MHNFTIVESQSTTRMVKPTKNSTLLNVWDLSQIPFGFQSNSNKITKFTNRANKILPKLYLAKQFIDGKK